MLGLGTRSVRALSRLVVLAGLGLAMLGVATPAHAVPLTFASYTQNFNGQTLNWSDNGDAFGTFSTTPGAGVSVDFQYVGIGFLPAQLQGTQQAIMSVTVAGNTTTPAATLFGTVIQPVQPSITIQFTRVPPFVGAPFNGLTNLLTVTFTGRIVGSLGGTTASLSGDNTLAPPDTVTFSSDFLSFQAIAERSVSISLNQITAPLTLTGNLLDAFTAFTTGSFGANPRPVVPEPASVALVGLGLIAAPLALRRRKRSE